MSKTAKSLSPLIPYIAVLIGMYSLNSAWIAIGLYHVGMAIALLGSRGKKTSGKPTRAGTGMTLLAIAVYSGAGVGIYVLWPYLGPSSNEIAAKLQGFGIDRHIWPYFAAYFCIVNSVLEELFWRGLLEDPFKGLVLNDLLFGGYHALVLAAFVGPVWTGVVFAACAFAGWLWRMQRTVTGGLALPIVTHLIADFGIVAALNFRLFA